MEATKTIRVLEKCTEIPIIALPEGILTYKRAVSASQKAGFFKY
ncbi:hypothetical protein [Chryseobacterium sp. JK1]